MQKILAVVSRGVEKSLQVEKIRLSDPKEKEVVVKIMATGVCASDVHVVRGNMSSPFPVVLGHEGAGIVEAVGSQVKTVKVGDRVALSWTPDCGHCFFCNTGYRHLCQSSAPFVLEGGLLDGTSRLLTENGEPLYHYSFLSTWAEYAVVAEASCILLEGIDFVPASLIGCAVMTGVGAAVNTARVNPGSSVVVIGLGGVGLNVIQGARLCGAEKIIGIDTNPNKKVMAETLGLTHYINSKDVSPLEVVRELTDGIGADYCFDVVGHHSLIELGYELIRPRGMLISVGVGGEGSQASLTISRLPREEKIITGSFYGSANCRVDFPKIARLYQKGDLLLDPLVSQVLTLDQINQAIDDLEKGSVTRTVLKPHD